MAAVDQFGELYLIQYRSVVQMKIFQNENKNLEQDKIEICRSCILCLLHLRGVCAEKYLGDCYRKFLGFFWILHTHNTIRSQLFFRKLLRACKKMSNICVQVWSMDSWIVWAKMAIWMWLDIAIVFLLKSNCWKYSMADSRASCTSDFPSFKSDVLRGIFANFNVVLPSLLITYIIFFSLVLCICLTFNPVG